jgi:beta-1,4-N-acetylglucosaminyltransferase
MGKRAFVTVGSTRFPGLIKAVLTDECIRVLVELGYSELRVQYGSDISLFREGGQPRSGGISLTGFDYSPSIDKEMREADLVISHAGTKLSVKVLITGSGSILEVLHLGKLLVAVPNSSLMDNHQAELAKALSDEGYLLQSWPEYKILSCLSN